MASNQLYMIAKRFLRSSFAWFKSERLPDKLVRDLNDALVRSKGLTKKFERDFNNALSDEVLDKLEKDKSVEDALAVCEANRKTMLMLFLARSSNNSSQKKLYNNLFDDLQEIVNARRNSKIKIARVLLKDGPRKEFLIEIISKSELRRFDILEALKKRDMQEAINLMWKAIKKAMLVNDMYTARELIFAPCNFGKM